jgi:hypothetical protein
MGREQLLPAQFFCRAAATSIVKRYNHLMGRLFADTTQAIEDEFISRLNQVPPWRKLEMVAQLNTAVREMIMAGLHRRYPDDSPEKLHRWLAEALLGPELAHPIYNYLPKEVHVMQSEPIAVMLVVAELFERMGINYVIGGSMASAFYGVGRSTMDVDFLADVHMEHVEPLSEALRPDFYLDEDTIRSAIERRSGFNLIHLATMFKVDVFIQGTRGFDSLQLGRHTRAAVTSNPTRQVYLLSPEDVVVAKLDWYQLGDRLSDRQWRDILGVLIAQAGQLDIEYMRQNADDLGVRDLLERAFLESGY